MMKKSLAIMAAGALLAVMGIIALGWGFGLIGPVRVAHVSGPMGQQAYVWQRSWSPGLVDRLRDVSPLDGLVVLAAEVTWNGAAHANRIKDVMHVAIDPAALRAAGKPVGLAIRINRFSGDYATAAEQVANIAVDVVTRARQAGLTVGELQLDYDCPTSKLAGYRQWVKAVKAKLPDQQVVVTTLPSWMSSGDFGPLVREAGGFVLQVHSVQRPTTLADVPPLCDPLKAKRWVERAARYGVPFRVALPTYAYLLGFDAQGKFIGAASEGGAPAGWPGDAQLMRLSADPVVMAALVRTWTANRPALMRGLIWYRLPIDSDTLNWRRPTLVAVMSGSVTAGKIEAKIAPNAAGALDVKICNAGQTDVPMDMEVALRWTGDEPIARDVLGGFVEAQRRPGQWVLKPGPDVQRAAAVLGVGEQRTIAWMRFEKNTEVQGHVSSPDH